MSFDFKVNIGQKERGKEAGDIEALFSDSTPKKKKKPTLQSKIFIFLFNKQFNENGNCIAT